jgi:hypothetical protein
VLKQAGHAAEVNGRKEVAQIQLDDQRRRGVRLRIGDHRAAADKAVRRLVCGALAEQLVEDPALELLEPRPRGGDPARLTAGFGNGELDIGSAGPGPGALKAPQLFGRLQTQPVSQLGHTRQQRQTELGKARGLPRRLGLTPHGSGNPEQAEAPASRVPQSPGRGIGAAAGRVAGVGQRDVREAQALDRRPRCPAHAQLGVLDDRPQQARRLVTGAGQANAAGAPAALLRVGAAQKLGEPGRHRSRHIEPRHFILGEILVVFEQIEDAGPVLIHRSDQGSELHKERGEAHDLDSRR